MNDNVTAGVNPPATLWREAWKACKRVGMDLLPWVLGFAALMAVCNFYIVRDEMHTAQTALASIENQAGPEDIQSLLSEYKEPPVVRAAEICGDIISFVGFYYFCVLYLRREPLAPGAMRPDLSPLGFWKWLVQIVKAAACVLGLALGVFLIGLLLAALSHVVLPVATQAIAVVGAVAAMLALIYTGIRFLFVSPLALSAVEPSVKLSWDMTKAHWWRLLWGYFCIGWSVFVVFLIAFLVLTIVMYLLTTPDSPLFVGGLSILMALYAATNLAMSSIYVCVACRILRQEQRLPGASESGSIL